MPTPTIYQVDELRRMVAENTDTSTYSDTDLQAMILKYPLPDSEGRLPTHVYWSGRWNLNLAAADIWEEKAGATAGDFNFQADGGNYSRAQVHEHCMTMARRYRAKRPASIAPVERAPTRRFAAPWPYDIVGNAPEGDY